MSYNFYFISGKNPAATVQSLQQVPAGPQEPRPRPVLQLLDRPQPSGNSPQIAPLTEANLVLGTSPAPGPRNAEILSQRSASIREEARRLRRRRSRSRRRDRSRTPTSQRSKVTGLAELPAPPLPPPDLPPGQWEQNLPKVWKPMVPVLTPTHPIRLPSFLPPPSFPL